MKILKINVYGFGKWQDQQFDLTNGLTVFSGPNEAGKSTLRQFILSVLFGFRTKRGADRYLRYEPKNGSKYGGELLIENHDEQYLLTRVKGKSGGKLTITNVATQEVLANDELSNLLGSVDETLFNEMFSFSQSELAEVRQLDRDEFRKRVLKIGAVGSDEWIGLQSSFEKSADKIYAPKGRVRPLNKLLKEYDSLSQSVQKAANETELYKQYATDMNLNQTELSQLQVKIETSKAQLDKLKHDLSGWDAYQKYLELAPKLNSHFVEISSDLMQAVEHNHQQISEVAQTLQTLQEKISDLKQKEQQNPRILFYSSHEQEFENIRQDLNKIENVVIQDEQLGKKQVEIDAEQNQIRRQLGIQETVPEPFSEEEFDQLQRDLKQKSERTREKQNLQNQVVELQDKLLKTSNPNSNNSKDKLKMSFSVIGFIIIILPWALSLSMGVKIGLLVLGLLIILGGWLINPNENKTDHAEDDLQTQVTSLQKQLQEITEQSKDVNERIQKLGVAKGISQTDPQTWLAMQNDLKRFERLSEDQRANQSQQHNNQEIIAVFNERTKILADWVVLTGSINQQLKNLADYFKKIEQEQKITHQNKQDLKYYQDRFNQVELESKKAKQAESEYLQKLSLKNWESFETAKKAQFDQEAMIGQVAQLKQQLGESTLTDLQHFSDQEEIQSQLHRQENNLTQLRDEQEKLVEQKTVLNTQMQQLANDETYANLQQQQANLEAEILVQTRDWLTEKLAAQWIDETLSVASQGRLPKIMNYAEQYFSLLTNKRYNKISFDDETIVVFDSDHQSSEVGELSQGTAEQLYVSIRLAFVKVMADLVSLPIIIDDGFVNFDSNRKQNVMALLNQISEEHQVIYFTADDQIDDLDTKAQVIRLK